MRIDLDNLPVDTALLHSLVRDMAAVVDHCDGEIERLQLIIKKLQRGQFGRRSERMDDDQLALALEDLDGDVGRIEADRPVVIAESDPAPSKRKPLPDHLPREEILLDVPSDACQVRGPPYRFAARQNRSKPIADAFRTWLEQQLARISGRSTLAEAMRYALARWDGLTRFLHDGRIELDTNPVEWAIRLVALGRKNHLFAGSDGGGSRWAIVCSLIETAKLNGVEPYVYLRDVLTRMVNGHPVNRLDELLPWAWKAANPVNP